MRLKNLLAQVRSLRVNGSLETEVDAVRFDSRTVGPGSVFVALSGERSDGHRHVAQALERGAAAVVVGMGRVDAVPADCSATVIEVEDPRLALAELAAIVHRQPSQRLKVAGVTGTNGKTTTAWLIKHLCDAAGLRCGLIGTIRYDTGARVVDAARTTPEAPDLQAMLAEMRDSGCRAAALEVSSHAIHQDRIRGIEFDAAVFTNLTQDHLDYHRTMEDYAAAKSRWFTELLFYQEKKKLPACIVNGDDRHGQTLIQKLERAGARVVPYGVGARAAFRASSVRAEHGGTAFTLDAEGRQFLVRTPLLGTFNVYNSIAALAAAQAMGVGLRDAVEALAKVPSVPGRLQLVPTRQAVRVFVDYAHTPDALVNVLRTARELAPARLITVFGCGGDRDRAKRPLMARAAEEFSDLILATSDNPRSEDPRAILSDVEAGFQSKPYEIHVDRREAIRRAVLLAEQNDVVVIAGKGHEPYQEIAGRREPFDDVEVARAALDDRALARDERRLQSERGASLR